MNYYIQGDITHCSAFKNRFAELGFKTNGCEFADYDCLYFTTNGQVCSISASGPIANIIKTHPDYKELELPKPHYDIANFHAGMPVLVRDDDSDDDDWTYALFSHYNSNRTAYKFSASGDVFRQCIPFNDDTKHLLGTTDMPSEEYINW